MRDLRNLFAESPEFHRLVTGADDVRLARVALEIAGDAYPHLDLERYLDRIETLADRVRDRTRDGASALDVVGQINWVLFIEEGLGANQDEYYDPRNSYLNEVLDRRLGIPITLSVLYWTVAQHLGIPIAGVNFPAHFMLRVDESDRTWFVDPFDAGAIHDHESCQQKLSRIVQQPVALTEALAAPCSVACVVARMLRNLKAIYWSRQDVAALLPIQRRLVALNPFDGKELRDLAWVCIQSEHLGEAMDLLEAYLRIMPSPADADEIEALLKVVRRQIASWN